MNTGGPAFPIAASTVDPRDGVYCQNGMTLLDWYAGQALPWCLSEFAGNAEDGTQYAEAAYQIAAAMLAEKARREAVVKQSSTTQDAGKVAELQAANRELVEALENVLATQIDPNGSKACKDARAILAKHKGAA